MADVLDSWHNFYGLLGAAAATLTGLLFVAASVGARVFSTDRPAPLRVFLSASLVQFGSVLATALIMNAPLRRAPVLGLLVLSVALVGFGYSVLALRDTLRDGLWSRMDREDRGWYLVVPLAAYLFHAVSGVMLVRNGGLGFPALALSTGTLMVVGIHNAWDITIWTVMRRKE